MAAQLSQTDIDTASVQEETRAPSILSESKEKPSAATSTTVKIPPVRLAWLRGLGSGIRNDVRARAPWYWSDWRDAWNYRVIPATALIFFAKWVIYYIAQLLFSAHSYSHVPSVLPGIAFSLDLIETTEQYGVAEVLLSSFMAAFIFSVFGAQPLTIAGVTGTLSVQIPFEMRR